MNIAGMSLSELLAYEAGFKTGVAFAETDKKLKARKKKIVKKLKRNN